MSAHARRRARRAGFTLVELMVAMVIGAFLVATVYTMSSSSSREFQEQQRLTELQLATRLAVDRVRRDVERAGLHGVADSSSSRAPVPPTPPIVAVDIDDRNSQSLAAINAHPAGASNTTAQGDRLRLVGNFVTSDSYLVRSMNGAGNAVILQTQWQGFRRSFSDLETGNTIDAAVFQSVFRAGRMLHIRTPAGFHFFVTITGSAVSGDTATVTFNPAIGVGGLTVGGFGEGAMVAPLTMIEYALDASPGDLPAPRDADVTGPNVGLVRREVSMADRTTVIASRTVLEWAVHFDVRAIIDGSAPGAVPSSASFERVDEDDDVTAAAEPRSSRVRGLSISVGARSRMQDPEFPWVAPTAGAPLTRFRVFTDRRGAARVRVATVEAGVPNLYETGL